MVFSLCVEGLNPFAVVREGLVALGKWLGEVKVFQVDERSRSGLRDVRMGARVVSVNQ